MYIPKDDTQNYPFWILQLVVETLGHSSNEPTNQNSLKVPKVVSSTNMNILFKNFVD